jgi:O-antigen ligase
LIGGLALAGGGYEVGSRHVAGLAAWLVVVLLLLLGAASRATVARPLHVGAALLSGLALFSALSILWSGSVELSVIEADRVLVYLAVFLGAFLMAQTTGSRQRFAEGLAIAVALVALLGVLGRLLPDFIDFASTIGQNPRLSYPLGYWNADGLACGVGVALLIWCSRWAREGWLRWGSVAAMPAVLLALYFTFSRGGVLALAIACGCLIALSHDRVWHLCALAIGALGALPAVLAVQARGSLGDNVAGQTTIDQGHAVFVYLLAGTALAVLLYAGLRQLEARGGRRLGRALEISRNPKLLRGIALGLALLAIAAAIAVGGRAWHQFTRSDVQFESRSNQTAARLDTLSGTGRSEFWRVALHEFGEEPIRGTGAGTYRFAWDEHRKINLPVHNAHSLYLQIFGELGLVGGLLIVGLVLSLLWFALQAWRAASEPHRDRYAVLLAVMLAFAVGAGIDWFWQIAAVGFIFFIAAGVTVAARCRQLAGPRELVEEEGGNFGLAVAVMAVAWISAIALIGPLLVDHELKRSRALEAEGNVASAVEHANTARSIEPWAASPYVQLGLLAEGQREYPLARLRFSDAIEREDRNWQLYYLRSRVEREAGETAASQADLEKALELNPLGECLQPGAECP